MFDHKRIQITGNASRDIKYSNKITITEEGLRKMYEIMIEKFTPPRDFYDDEPKRMVEKMRREVN